MKKTMGLVYAVLLLLIISAAGCGNVISGGKNDDAAILPMALASPLSDSFLTQNGNIVILFNGSMNANTLSLSGHLGPEAGSTWSKTTNENDTLTIHPLSKWSEGDGLTLKVDCNDRAGKAIKQINLTYMIKVYLSEVEQFGTGFDDRACDVAIDSSGNIYITGNTKGDLVGNTMAGDSDIFLVKYNSTGIKQWTRQTGSSANDSASGMAIDSDGNIYITGRTDGSLDGNTNAGCSDIFLVKYNSSGEKLWTRQMGSTGSDWAIGVSTDSDGNIYITGQTDGDLVGNTNTVDSDIFLVKYNSSGVKQWTRQMGSSANDSPTEIVIDIFGFIYITGHTCGNMDGNTNAGDDDIFLVKYNLSGDKQWTRQIGTDKADHGNGVSVDSSGNIYVAGQTGGVLDGGTNAGDSDIVLVKYNSDGDRQWTRQTGTAKADNASGVSVDDSGNIFVAGQTDGGLNGDANAGESDIVLVKYDPDGERQWSRQTGTVNADIANEVTTDSSGNIYVAGFSVN
ncbi:MAG: hypothetical protein GY754_23105, partial [bacterium]|nr:hypothetical protein [bacterium]